MLGIVVERADDDASYAGENAIEGVAARVFEITHLAGIAAGEPFAGLRELGEFGGGSDAAEIEAESAGALKDPGGCGRAGHGSILPQGDAGRRAFPEKRPCPRSFGATGP